ncbi:MAG: BACON domain-containing protein [Prevotellaceae bacterium]|jgi:hypothetical protein|nr:BACON domain-containing protein [Prevotellaceae bacterium]
MKKKIKFFMTAATLLMMLASCSKNEGPQIWEVTPETSYVCFSADGLSILFTDEWMDEPATFTVTVPKKETWNVTSTQPWVHIAKTKNTFTLSADPVDIAPEPAIVLVKSGKYVMRSLFVKQEAALSVYPLNPVVFSPQGAADNETFHVYANRYKEWDAVSSQSWLSVSKNADEGTFSLSAAANTSTTASPPATVTVSSGTATPIVIDVTQEKPELTVTPSGTSLVFAVNGYGATLDGKPLSGSNLFYFNISTNINAPGITVTSPVYWIHIGTLTVNGVLTEFSVSAIPNSSYTPHPPGTITIKANNTDLPPVIINVSQIPR